MESFFEETLRIPIWEIAKVFVLLALAIYIVFAVIVVKQVKMMGQTLDGKINPAIRVIAFIHLLVAIFVFFLALVIL